jgi:hypothetical protein
MKRKPVKQRPRGPGWVAPKALARAIQSELVPAALALGWVARGQNRGRRDKSRFGEFEFERAAPGRFEIMGFDYAYGDKPEVWLCLARWTGEDDVCTSFETGNCADLSEHMKPFWRRWIAKLGRPTAPVDPLAQAIKIGLQQLWIAEAYLRSGARHPNLHLIAGRPEMQKWPPRSLETA